MVAIAVPRTCSGIRQYHGALRALCAVATLTCCVHGADAKSDSTVLTADSSIAELADPDHAEDSSLVVTGPDTALKQEPFAAIPSNPSSDTVSGADSTPVTAGATDTTADNGLNVDSAAAQSVKSAPLIDSLADAVKGTDSSLGEPLVPDPPADVSAPADTALTEQIADSAARADSAADTIPSPPAGALELEDSLPVLSETADSLSMKDSIDMPGEDLIDEIVLEPDTAIDPFALPPPDSTFKKPLGYIVVTPEPWDAKVFFAGRYILPMVVCTVEAGKWYTVRVEAENYKPIERSIAILKDQTADVHVWLSNLFVPKNCEKPKRPSYEPERDAPRWVPLAYTLSGVTAIAAIQFAAFRNDNSATSSYFMWGYSGASLLAAGIATAALLISEPLPENRKRNELLRTMHQSERQKWKNCREENEVLKELIEDMQEQFIVEYR